MLNQTVVEMERSEATLTRINAHLETLLESLTPAHREVMHIGEVAEKMEELRKEVAGRLVAVSWELDRTDQILREGD